MARSQSSSGHQGGFTLLEVMIAIVILAIGLLGLAGASTYVIRQVMVSELLTDRNLATQAVVEQIRAAPWGTKTMGADTVGDYVITWTSTPDINVRRFTLVVEGPGLTRSRSGGPAIRPNVVDTVRHTLLRP